MNEILSCFHSNETSLVGLLYCTIYFVGFYKRKCEFSCDFFSLASIRNERVYKLNKMLRLLTLWSKFCGVAIQLKPFVIDIYIYIYIFINAGVNVRTRVEFVDVCLVGMPV